MVILFGACARITEPVTLGSYYVENLTGAPLRVEATTLFGDSSVLSDSVPSGESTLFLEVSEGSGGHVLPSNFLRTFEVHGADSTGSQVVLYAGVHNTDWVVVDRSPRRVDLLLRID
ncbi:MAG: hypothetical protein IPM46_11485 [Flavobacteriales bacterium]|nr:hypothetical protein [Flavobacteriales bacterium]